MRHPFYLANALVDAALVVMAGWWPLAVLLVPWWLAIYLPVIRGEERYLAERFPHEYPDYQGRVPCLIPWRRPLPYSGDGFRWSNRNIAGGEELPRTVRLLAYPLLFFIVQGLRNHGLAWLGDGWNLTGLTGLIALYALAWELHGHQRQHCWILPAAMRGPVTRAVMGVAVIAAVYLTQAPRTSCDNFVSTAGALLLLLSVPIYSRQPMRAFIAEIVVLLGVIASGELLWLAPAMATAYTAWILDWNLVDGASRLSGMADASPSNKIAYWPYFYMVLVVVGAAVIGTKLVGHGLPYHWT